MTIAGEITRLRVEILWDDEKDSLLPGPLTFKTFEMFWLSQVLVFNCDGDFDFKSIGRIFTGLIKSGAWGCFDEFNRLEEDVLSAISQQIQVIQAALRDKCETVQFLGKMVKLDHDAGIFVTMNPKSKTYTGRSKLPDNLKSLFRSITMTYPNSELIAEVRFFPFERLTSVKLC